MSEFARPIGILVLVLWVSSIGFLIPIPPQRVSVIPESDPALREKIVTNEQKATGVPRAEIERIVELKLSRESHRIWAKWIFILLFVLLGTGAGVMALRRFPYWDYAVTVTSFFYIFFWITQLQALRMPEPGSLLDVYIWNLFNYMGFDSVIVQLTFIHREILLPIGHFFLMTFLVFRKLGNSTPQDLM